VSVNLILSRQLLLLMMLGGPYNPNTIHTYIHTRRYMYANTNEVKLMWYKTIVG